MEQKKPLHLFALIGAVCFVVQVLTDVIDTIRLSYSYNFWGYLWIVLTLALAAGLFLQNRLIVMAAAGVSALRWLILIFIYGLNFYSLLVFLAYAAIAALVFLIDRKMDLTRYLRFVPGGLILLSFLVDWVFHGAFSALFRGYLSFWDLLSALAQVAAVALAGLWVYESADMADVEPMTAFRRTEGGASAGTRPIVGSEQDGYCDMAKHVLLLLLTCGIWYLVWIYRATAFLNRVEDEEPRDPTKKLLLCMFVPFYSIYWTYVSAQRIDKMAARRGVPSDIGTLCLILAIFVGIIPPILMQDKMNAIVTASAPADDRGYGAPVQSPIQPAAPVSDANDMPVNDMPVNDAPVRAKPVDQAPAPAEKPVDVVAELKRYKELLDSGILTQEEFDAKKKQLLGL